MKLAEATAHLRSIHLPKGDFAVFGSGPLLARGVITEVNDLDVIARGPAWQAARSAGSPLYLPEHDITIISFFERLVTVGNSWAIGDVDIDTAIDTAELFEGIPYVRLEHVVAYKRVAGRAKDLEHLRRLDDWVDRSDY